MNLVVTLLLLLRDFPNVRLLPLALGEASSPDVLLREVCTSARVGCQSVRRLTASPFVSRIFFGVSAIRRGAHEAPGLQPKGRKARYDIRDASPYMLTVQSDQLLGPETCLLGGSEGLAPRLLHNVCFREACELASHAA